MIKIVALISFLIALPSLIIYWWIEDIATSAIQDASVQAVSSINQKQGAMLQNSFTILAIGGIISTILCIAGKFVSFVS
jgi:TRAP-type mannitol/chloroaromatic compound transport system permease small subunit